MKRLLFILVAIVIANSLSVRGNTISFTNEIGCGFEYLIPELMDIISSRYTIYEDFETDRFMEKYNEEIPSSTPEEPVILILIPNDDYFSAVFIQEDADREILTFRILANEGWLECNADLTQEGLWIWLPPFLSCSIYSK